MTPEEIEFVKLMNANYERMLQERPMQPYPKWLLMLCICMGFVAGVLII